MNVPITKPYFDEAEMQAVTKPLETGWVVQGPCVAEFEHLFAAYTGAAYAKATTSCTTALHLVLIACGISAGDEVLVPAFTYVASANVVEYENATPVFVDIDLRTFNIDMDRLEAALTSKTKAIMPVHLFGLCAEMDVVVEVAQKHGLAVIEDAACAVGSLYKGKHAGTFGDAGCFSFHPRKIICTGEGGMLTTNHSNLANQVEIMRSHGGSVSDLERHRKDVYLMPEHNIVGYNYRMTDFQGAIGVQQMKKLNWIVARRNELADRYTQVFNKVPGVTPPHVPEYCRHTYQSYVVAVKDDCVLSRNELCAKLQARGIATRQATHAVHLLGYYKSKYGLKPEDFPMAWKADEQSMTLPLYPQMTEAEQDHVIDNLLAILEGKDLGGQ